MQGPALMLTSLIVFTLLDTNSKLLSGSYGVGQVIFFRFLVLVPAFLLLRALRPGLGGPLTTTRPALHLLRAVCMMVSASSFFLGFRHMALAEGYLIFFTAPFLTLALAALVLREAVAPRAWMWCGVGFAGVALAMLPRLTEEGHTLDGAVWMLLGVVGFSVTQTVNRSLRGENSLGALVLWPGLLGLMLFGPLAALDWHPPSLVDALRLGLNGILAGSAIVLSAAAFRYADAARLGPYAFVALPASILFDAVLWGVSPSSAMLAGAVTVVTACVMSERTRRRV